MRGLLLIGVLASLSSYTPTACASLNNGDFSEGFSGWKGEVTDIFFNTTSDIDPPAAFTENFDVSSGSAVLSTSTLTDNIFSVILFQEFTISTISPGQELILSFDLNVSLTDAGFGDTAFAQLNHGTNFSQTVDLLSGSSLDITFLAGQTVELLFGVEDFDDLADSITVDNILITVIPEPDPQLLCVVGVGLFGVIISIRRRQQIN